MASFDVEIFLNSDGCVWEDTRAFVWRGRVLQQSFMGCLLSLLHAARVSSRGLCRVARGPLFRVSPGCHAFIPGPVSHTQHSVATSTHYMSSVDCPLMFNLMGTWTVLGEREYLERRCVCCQCPGREVGLWGRHAHWSKALFSPPSGEGTIGPAVTMTLYLAGSPTGAIVILTSRLGGVEPEGSWVWHWTPDQNSLAGDRSSSKASQSLCPLEGKKRAKQQGSGVCIQVFHRACAFRCSRCELKAICVLVCRLVFIVTARLGQLDGTEYCSLLQWAQRNELLWDSGLVWQWCSVQLMVIKNKCLKCIHSFLVFSGKKGNFLEFKFQKGIWYLYTTMKTSVGICLVFCLAIFGLGE